MSSKALVRGPKVVKTVEGSVTWRDKLKNYWKFAITSVGAILMALNELTPVFAMIPASQGTVTIAIAVLTAVLTLLKGNEQWVDGARYGLS
jgi:hypothetical protein